jgi:hypothetical protein
MTIIDCNAPQGDPAVISKHLAEIQALMRQVYLAPSVKLRNYDILTGKEIPNGGT